MIIYTSLSSKIGKKNYLHTHRVINNVDLLKIAVIGSGRLSMRALSAIDYLCCRKTIRELSDDIMKHTARHLSLCLLFALGTVLPLIGSARGGDAPRQITEAARYVPSDSVHVSRFSSARGGSVPRQTAGAARYISSDSVHISRNSSARGGSVPRQIAEAARYVSSDSVAKRTEPEASEVIGLIEDGYVKEELIDDFLDSYVNARTEERQHGRLSVNKLSIAALRDSLGVDSLQAASLVAYRHRKNGNIRSVAELKLIPYWDKRTIERVAPLITFEEIPVASWRKPSGEVTLSGGMPFEVRNDIWKDTYLGAPYEIQLRARGRASGIEYGVLADKDRYEPIFAYDTKGFDSYGAFLSYTPQNGILKQLILGDYGLSWGLGLVARHTFMHGVVPYSSNLRREKALRRVLSDNYNTRFRGAAVELGLKDFGLILAFSRQRKDGSFIEEDNLITSLRPETPHRTERELERRHRIAENCFAGRLQWGRGTLQLGVNGMLVRWDGATVAHLPGYSNHPFLENVVRSYVFSADGKWTAQSGRLALGMEVAVSEGNGAAVTATCRYNSGESGILLLSARHLSGGFVSLNGNSLTHFSTPGNEQGLFVRYRSALPYHLTLDSYLDFYRSLRPRARSKEEQIKGFAASATLTYMRNNRSKVYGSITLRKQNVTELVTRVLLGSEWQAATRWRMRLTGQYKRVHAEEEGLMLALQGSYRPTESIKLSLLGGYFATTSFAARTYLYVPRVRYTRMRSMFYGKGGVASMQLALKKGNWRMEGALTYIGTAPVPDRMPGGFDAAVSVSYRY